MPRKPGVSKVRATAPRSMSGRAAGRSPEPGNGSSPPAASWRAAGGSSSRGWYQRMTNTIERFFDHSKLDAQLVAAVFMGNSGLAWWLRAADGPVPQREKRVKYKARTIG